MSPEIRKNSLIIGCKVKNINQGEIIGYDIDNSIKYHRFIKTRNDNGKITYITKADNNYGVDIEEKQLSDFKSQILIKIPIIGFLFSIFENKIVTIIIIIVLCLNFSFNNYKIELSKERKNRKNR